jgi:hypothetical protein
VWALQDFKVISSVKIPFSSNLIMPAGSCKKELNINMNMINTKSKYRKIAYHNPGICY